MVLTCIIKMNTTHQSDNLYDEEQKKALCDQIWNTFHEDITGYTQSAWQHAIVDYE